MSKNLVIDAWIREAQEAAKLVEDIETRVKNQNLQQQQQLLNRPSDEIARSKLLEVGVKLDHLESLLHNPPSKPILSGGLADTKETNKKDNIYEHDQNKASVTENEAELLKPLISDDAPQSHMQVCWIISLIFGAAALIFILVILCVLL